MAITVHNNPDHMMLCKLRKHVKNQDSSAVASNAFQGAHILKEYLFANNNSLETLPFKQTQQLVRTSVDSAETMQCHQAMLSNSSSPVRQQMD